MEVKSTMSDTQVVAQILAAHRFCEVPLHDDTTTEVTNALPQSEVFHYSNSPVFWALHSAVLEEIERGAK